MGTDVEAGNDEVDEESEEKKEEDDNLEEEEGGDVPCEGFWVAGLKKLEISFFLFCFSLSALPGGRFALTD